LDAEAKLKKGPSKDGDGKGGEPETQSRGGKRSSPRHRKNSDFEPVPNHKALPNIGLDEGDWRLPIIPSDDEMYCIPPPSLSRSVSTALSRTNVALVDGQPTVAQSLRSRWLSDARGNSL
jgi:hypothetical protein